MKNNQKGLTLIEMMIAMVIGLLITGTVITMFISNVRSNRDSVSMIRLNQELRGVMTFISDELKRAGYSADPAIDTFSDELTVVGGSCLHYSYDEDGSGTQGADERFGFRLNVDTIEWSRSNTTTASCSTGTWFDITDTEIANITNFTVTSSPIVVGGVTINQLTVTITATTGLSGNTTASRTISEVIRLRNEGV